MGFQNMYHIHFISLLYGILIDVQYVKNIWIGTIRGRSEFEILKFFIYFLNKDTSFNIPLICLKFSTYVHEGHLEGSVSQNFFWGPSFYFM